MYESEANNQVQDEAQIPAEVIRAFTGLRGGVAFRTVLPWSEHCTECVWPSCYSTCDLYSPRPDGRCRRFADGMVRVESPAAANSYLLKIRFKRWGKLWTPGTVRLHSAASAEKLEKRDRRIGGALQQFPLPSLVRIAAAKKRYGFKKRVARATTNSSELPACFLLECYNPGTQTVPMSLIMRATDERARMPFQKLLDLSPGFHRIRIALQEIARLVNVRRPFDIELTPNEEAGEPTLYFGLMEFVVEAGLKEDQDQLRHKDQNSNNKNQNNKDTADTKNKVKCVVWDLDNTLWDGVLVEDGIEGLRLKAGIGAVIEALDARGILNSIASKNNSEEALQAVKQFGLQDYFLCPQISWHPKSEGIKAIAQQLNIGLDSLLFVDDSKFELEEVTAACPEVRSLRAEEFSTLLERSDCRVPVTDESKARRKFYQVEMDRQTAAKTFSSDYMAFLRHCQIRLRVQPMTEENLQRVHELTQRTNQMNFSGNRYDREVLRSLLSNPDLDTFVLSCEDRFGSYGVIGFSLVDRREPRMTDLMFSCRVQSKRVEHAFLAYIIRKYIAETRNDFYANYRKTARNAPSGQVFADLLMEEVDLRDGVSLLRFPKERQVADDGVVDLMVQESLLVGQA